ncbi:VOC family protein [Streptomyces endocoffeicus]|uniref:VOC family protein n=1 Tax=Streptomyces endocoffeicus TaxID=2898945 RepID=UPI0027DD6E0C|nr:VOC family protein [Streptomyces endocoffeicus]
MGCGPEPRGSHRPRSGRGGDRRAERAPDPRVRPRWYVHFRVPDVTAAVAAARAAGGTVALPPDASPTDRQAILCDPDGGLFTVTAA